MSTTSLAVELLVIGASGFMGLVLLGFAIFGLPDETLNAIHPLLLAVPGLSVIYVIGIVIDRLADSIFEPFARKKRKGSFSDAEAYLEARTRIYRESENLTRLYEYSRSRLRIARGWTVGAMFIALGFATFAIKQRPLGESSGKLALFVGTILVLIAGGCIWAWSRLVTAEYRNIKQQSRSARAK